MQGTYWGTRLSDCSSNKREKVIVGLNEKFLVTDHDFNHWLTREVLRCNVLWKLQM